MDKKQITKERIEWVKEHAEEILQSSDGMFCDIPREIPGGNRGTSIYSLDSWKDMMEKTCETNLDKEKKEQNKINDMAKLELEVMTGYLCKCHLEVESFNDLKVLFDIFIKNGYRITIEKDTTKSFFTIIAEKIQY